MCAVFVAEVERSTVCVLTVFSQQHCHVLVFDWSSAGQSKHEPPSTARLCRVVLPFA